MYSKQEMQRTRQEFWTAFGQYMSPVLSADGEKINWVNYKTGKKGIRFTMDADKQRAIISIVISYSSDELRYEVYHRLLQVKKLMEEEAGADWIWEKEIMNEHGRMESRVYKELRGVSIMNKNDWPEIISFFKPMIIALDAFWSMAKYSFDNLQ